MTSFGFVVLVAVTGVLSWALVRIDEARAAKQRGRLVAPGETCELGSARLPRRASTWRASVSIDYPEGRAPGWSVTRAGTGARGTFAGDGAVLDAPVSDHEHSPVRAWLVARDGRVCVLVASKGKPWRVVLRALEEVDACRG